MKNKKIIINILIALLILFSITLLIILFNVRDLAEKPIIDVIITSVATISSGIIAAGVAYFVANMQIKHGVQQEKDKQQKKLISRVKLVVYELTFISETLENILESEETPEEKSAYLKANISTKIWDSISIDLIDDLDASFFNPTINMYFDLNILLREYESTLLTKTFRDSIKIKTQLENFISTNQEPHSFY